MTISSSSSASASLLQSSSSSSSFCLFLLPHSPPPSSQHYLRDSSLFTSTSHQKQTLNLKSPVVKSQNLQMNTNPMSPPYNVLITGSTKGIGYALAKEFLKAGDNVLICSRSAERVESALQSLREEFGQQRVWGTTCDVRKGEDVKDLAAFAQENLKFIDIWINNAGSNAYSFKPLAESSDDDLIEVVTTNTLGLMICCREAIKMMLNQPRGGHIFNTDGAGSDGRPTPRFAAYGATKRSVVHLTKSLQSEQPEFSVALGIYAVIYVEVYASHLRGSKTGYFYIPTLAELQMQDVQNVIVHNLSPGMVTTDLLMSGATTKQAKFFINVLAEPAEVVAEYLVPSIRSVPSNGSMKPTYIRFLTGMKAYSQIFSVEGLLLGPEETGISWKIETHKVINELRIHRYNPPFLKPQGVLFTFHWYKPPFPSPQGVLFTFSYKTRRKPA